MRRFRDGPAHSPTAARIDDYDAPRTTAPTHCTIPQPLSALAERPHPRRRATRRIAHTELFARHAGKISMSRARCAHGSNGRSIFSTTLSRVIFQEFILPCISIHFHIPCFPTTSRSVLYSHSAFAITLLLAIPTSVPSRLTSAYALHGTQPWNSFQHEAEQRLTLQSTQCSNPAFCGARFTIFFPFSLQTHAQD